MGLLSRDKFREAVFLRDNNRCVICGNGLHNGYEIDAHHILERRLWSDGGYYIDNGSTLCSDSSDGCHYKAETTFLSVEDIRIAAKIEKPIIPDDMYSDGVYDKWGNVILDDGRRTKGPLYGDESVQKVLADYILFGAEPIEFVEYVKYPRTYHLNNL